jgi:hypothetical protein
VSKTIRIGGASGYWGDSDMALPQFLKAGGLDYIVFDYLAEITMSILARQRAKDPTQGYAADFVSLLKPHLKEIKRQGVKILSNAGGVNPRACGEAMRAAVKSVGADWSRGGTRRGPRNVLGRGLSGTGKNRQHQCLSRRLSDF